MSKTSEYVSEGLTLGSCLAIVISYDQWHSVAWAIVHGCLSWAYVIYFVVTHLDASHP